MKTIIKMKIIKTATPMPIYTIIVLEIPKAGIAAGCAG
jgi:hypothetical protein